MEVQISDNLSCHFTTNNRTPPPSTKSPEDTIRLGLFQPPTLAGLVELSGTVALESIFFGLISGRFFAFVWGDWKRAHTGSYKYESPLDPLTIVSLCFFGPPTPPLTGHHQHNKLLVRTKISPPAFAVRFWLACYNLSGTFMAFNCSFPQSALIGTPDLRQFMGHEGQKTPITPLARGHLFRPLSFRGQKYKTPPSTIKCAPPQCGIGWVFGGTPRALVRVAFTFFLSFFHCALARIFHVSPPL